MTDIIVRPMIAGDLAESTRIYRLAFGTFLGAPDPARFRLDIRALETRVAIERARELCDCVLPGLDLSREIRSIERQRLGETVLLGEPGALSGFALCHIGGGTEAGEGVLFVKFAAVSPGAAQAFERLLDAVEALAAERGVQRIAAGVNTGRRDAYRRMLARGFRTTAVGVAMHRPGTPGTLRPDVYMIDDWR